MGSGEDHSCISSDKTQKLNISCLNMEVDEVSDFWEAHRSEGIGTFTSSLYRCDVQGTCKRKGRMRGPAPGSALLHGSNIQNRAEAGQGR